MSKPDINKIHLLIFINTLGSLAFFITIPLIALYSLDYFKLSAAHAGLLSAIWPATIFICSFFVGRFADTWGYTMAIRLGSALCAAAFASITFAPNVFFYAISLLLFGIGKSLQDTSIRATLAKMCPPRELGKFLRLRYLWNNVACVGGPLLGFLAYKTIFNFAFAISSAIYLVAHLVVVTQLKTPDSVARKTAIATDWRESFQHYRNSDLQLFILSGMFILMAYGSYETIMPIVVAKSNGLRPSFGILAAINALTVIVSQLALMRWASGVSNRHSVYAGYVFQILGFLLFAIETTAVNTLFMTIVATVLFSFGESILFPATEMVLNDLAQGESRAAYFAAADTKQIGFFLGPAIGGAVFQWGGSSVLFLGIAGLLTIASFCSWRLLNKAGRPLPSTELSRAS